jgi:integrase
VRRYIDDAQNRTAQYGLYRVATIGLADDFQDGVGKSYVEALQAALSAGGADTAGSTARGDRQVTVADAVHAYIAWLKVHRKTARDAELRAEAHIFPRLGHFKLKNLTTTTLNSWRDELAASGPRLRTRKGQPVSHAAPPTNDEEKRARQNSANRVLTILKAALNKAFIDGRTNDDVAWRRLKTFRNVNAARPGHLTTEEAQRLINAADASSGFRDLVNGALMTGARYGELTALRCRDFAHGKVHVARSKSGKPRDIVLTDECAAFFAALTAGRAPEERVFTRADGAPWAHGHQTRPMLEACARASIKPAIGFHALRTLGRAWR